VFSETGFETQNQQGCGQEQRKKQRKILCGLSVWVGVGSGAMAQAESAASEDAVQVHIWRAGQQTITVRLMVCIQSC